MGFSQVGIDTVRFPIVMPARMKDDETLEEYDVKDLLINGIIRRLPPDQRETINKMTGAERQKEARKIIANTAINMAIEGKRQEENERINALSAAITSKVTVDEAVVPG